MMGNKDFCVFILTHGRADRVYTYDTLKKTGYTGRVVFVVDNEDKTVDDYKARFGEQVYVFDKLKISKKMDEGDNFNDRRAIIYARNACFEIAKKLGIKYFIQFDDDYTDFRHMKDERDNYIDRKILNLDAVLDAMLDYYKAIPALSIAMAQGGDFIGGKGSSTNRMPPKRKCMNSFICSTDRPFKFFGRVNEDVNTYANFGSRGKLFLTVKDLKLQQKQTQKNKGGMTELYLDSGTYVKSFYTVMYQPSSVKIAVMNSEKPRIHHALTWRNTVPCILSPDHKK